MAVQFTTKHTRSSVYFFAPEDIVIKPELNGRHDLPDITDLKADLTERGQLQPVLIRNDGGKPVLCAGFSRWRAMSELNAEGANPPLKLMCVYVKMDEREALLANYKENRVRNTTTPLDDAHHFALMERWGLKPKEIAAQCGVTQAYVNRRLKLATITPEAKAALDNGRLKPSAAEAIAKLSAKQQKELVEREGKITSESIAEASGEPPRLTAKQKLEKLQAAIEEAADVHTVKAVQEFARKLLEIVQ